MKTPRSLTFALALAAVAFGGAVASGQTALYTANTTPSVVVNGTVHYLQVVRLAQGPGTYSINSISISLNLTSGNPESIIFAFYTGVDTRSTSTSALAKAAYLGSTTGNTSQPTAGNYSFTYNLTTPFNLTATGTGEIGIEVLLIDPNTKEYATEQNGRFTASAPTVGISTGFVWNDADLNNVFTGAEQTTFGMANASVRLALAGVQTAPAPIIKSYIRSGTVSTLTIDSYTGRTYQLQRTASLTSAWTNVGGAVTGSTGTVLTFTGDDPTDPQAFYRVLTGP